jgi:hypothetical protein
MDAEGAFPQLREAIQAVDVERRMLRNAFPTSVAEGRAARRNSDGATAALVTPIVRGRRVPSPHTTAYRPGPLAHESCSTPRLSLARRAHGPGAAECACFCAVAISVAKSSIERDSRSSFAATSAFASPASSVRSVSCTPDASVFRRVTGVLVRLLRIRASAKRSRVRACARVEEWSAP